MTGKILFIADSRGRFMNYEISKHLHPSYYEFIWRGGLRLEETADFAYSTILRTKPSIVYVLTGICSLTKITDRDPWTASLRIPTVEGTTNLFLEGMDKAYREIFSLSSRVGNPIMVVFPTQTGLNFTAYNSYPDDLRSPHQKILNSAITEINRYIVSMNSAVHIRTPFLAASSHPRCRRRYRSTYTKLTDGCHPSSELCEIWAYKLALNACRNSDYYSTYCLINHMY